MDSERRGELEKVHSEQVPREDRNRVGLNERNQCLFKMMLKKVYAHSCTRGIGTCGQSPLGTMSSPTVAIFFFTT